MTIVQPRSRAMEVFVVTKGHAFLRDPFEAMLRAIGIEPTFVDQPAAAMLLNPEAMRRYDAILLYDMPGMDFRAPRADRPVDVVPDPAFVAGFEALLHAGKGVVALHHALAGWPGWPAYADALGGAFLYRPRIVRGKACPDSGFAADQTYTVRTAPGDHPVLAGLPERFVLSDELYWNEVFEDDIHPLLVRETDVPSERFRSACRAVRRVDGGEGVPWRPSAGSRVIGWAKAAGNSPLIYLQPGDGPKTYGDPHYRTLLGNSLRWVASTAAAEWVRQAHELMQPA